jgi:uncharacterized protein (DUF58 family)
MSVLDLAKIREYQNVEFLAKQLVEGFITGLHKSPFHGFSVEFAEHRLYNSGESTRHLDWKVFAKTDKLFVKRYEEETNLRCHLLIDTSSSMAYPAKTNGKLAFSALAAGTIALMLQKQRDAISLLTFSDKIDLHTECKSTSTHLHKIFLGLESILKDSPKNTSTSVVNTLHQIADKINKRSLVIIFSDMFENIEQQDIIFSALQHLKHNMHEVLLFHVIDKKTEIDFEFDERPHEFIDLETGQSVKVQPSQVKEKYQKAVQEFSHELKLKAGQYKIDFIETDINQGFDQIMSTFLSKRKKMR